MRNRWMGLWLAFISLGASSAWAEPYLAAWKGVNCNACHLNQTGGWGRNDFGKNYGNSLETFDWQGLSDAAQVIKHNTPSFVVTGVDIHERYIATFNKNSALDQNAFQSFSYFPGREVFSFEAKVNEVVSGVFTYQLDETTPRETYALVSGLPEGLYFKLGRFTIPYGLELADDTSLVRGALLDVFSFDSTGPDGIEAGIYPGSVFLNAALVNGTMEPLADSGSGAVTQTISEKIISAKGGVNFSDFTLAGSLYGENLDMNTKRVRYGGFGWGRIGPVVILAELDGGYDDGGDVMLSPLSPVTVQNNYTAYHASAEVDLGSSVYLRGASEYIDHTTKNAGVFDGFRHVLSLRTYPVRNLKFQVDVARMDATPNSPYAMAVGGPNYSLTADAFVFY